MTATILQGDERARQRPCLRCGYSLRMLGDARHCPECGLAVWLSLSRNESLDCSNPAWLSRIARGMILMSAIEAAGFIAAGTTFCFPRYGFGYLRGWVLLPSVVFLAFQTIALIMLTTREGRYPDRHVSARMGLWLGAIISLIACALIAPAAIRLRWR